MAKPITVIDFETEGIERRPEYPPRPAGVAIERPGGKRRYYAFNHPTENNSTKAEATAALREAYRSGDDLLFQNGKFDVDVADVHLGLKVPSWERIQDTLYLLFLANPYAHSFQLKPNAERLLGMKPEERDAVREWVMENVPEAKGKPKTWKDWSTYICRAPGSLVGKYAMKDLGMTKGLYKHLLPQITANGMLPAYDRERHLMPILLRNEREGMRVNLEGLERDIPVYERAMETADAWLRRRLGKPGMNVDSDDEFGRALDEAGIVTDWILTKTGKKSVSKKNMTLDMFRDVQVASVYGYRNRLKTCLSMFMLPWREQARKTGGTVHTHWNQVRQSGSGNGNVGARTGRPSSTPNFFNIPKTFEDRGDGWTHPRFLRSLPPLPLCRKYVLPDKGEILVHRDYSQQELRMLAHFEDGELMAEYNENPRLDVHGIVHDGILRLLRRDFIRTYVKNFVFQKIYGGGIPAITAALHCDVRTANQVVACLMEVLPGYDVLERAIRDVAKSGGAIRTWGGREYYQEPSGYSKKYGRVMDFAYKLLNYLIQGSCADVTKEATIRYDEHPKRQARFIVSVYDEMNISAAPKRWKAENEVLRECMEGIEVDVPMLTEGKTGPNWGTLTKLKEK